MAERWIAAEAVFNGTELHRGAALRLQDDIVVEVGPAPKAADMITGVICPGFVDLQVNGGGGVLLNNMPTREGIATIVAAHRAAGTVALMPTVITDAPDVLKRAVDAVLDSRDVAGVIGLHIEGPHISLAKRGVHAEAHIRPMDNVTVAQVARLRAENVPVMITVAPEAVTRDQIAQLRATGVVISIGHTDAKADAVAAAFGAGATCATHLFNAMSQMQGRAPGAVGTALDAGCYAGIICDGHHVDDRMIALALRAHARPERVFLVSDAMATVGGPKQFDLYGAPIALRDGRLQMADGKLAGAHVTQADGVKRLVEAVGLPLDQALRMATYTPAACIGVPSVGQLVGRRASDVIVLDDALRFVASLDRVQG